MIASLVYRMWLTIRVPMRNPEKYHPSRTSLNLTRMVERLFNDESAQAVSDEQHPSRFCLCALSFAYQGADHVLSMIAESAIRRRIP